jgi:hypothetical protein
VPHRIDELGAFLLGTWHLRRSVLASGVEVGSFTGTATFDDDGDGVVHYHEQGTLHLDGQRVPATRRLAYRVAGSRAQVTFEDGRPFHDLDLRDGVDHAEHPCGADRYHGRFEVVDHDTWHHAWHVTGPHKDHVISTLLTRDQVDEPDAAPTVAP